MRASKCVCGQTRRLRAATRVSCTIRMVEPMVTASPGQHRDPLAVLQRDVAHLGPVDAADVLDLEHARRRDVQPRVQARRERIGDADVRVVGASDRQAAAAWAAPARGTGPGPMIRRWNAAGGSCTGASNSVVSERTDSNMPRRKANIVPASCERRCSRSASVKLSVRQTSCRIAARQIAQIGRPGAPGGDDVLSGTPFADRRRVCRTSPTN